MMTSPTLLCKDDRKRRRLARDVKLNGLDYVEVTDDQRHLIVFFLGKAPQWLTVKHLRLEGGRRVRGIQVQQVTITRSDDPEQDDCMTITVDRPGDFSDYTLCVVALDEAGRPTDHVPADFDPRYACLCFSFKAACPTDLDCLAEPLCPEPVRAQPSIDYLAKDYASFRRLILDRLSLVMPDWQERHTPDLGITLVELLAYVGDHLSYFQDAVATEAYLDTARQRISVRRHVRLIDYVLHEGSNARAWVTLMVLEPSFRLRRGDFRFITSGEDVARQMMKAVELSQVQPATYLVFEPIWLPGEHEIEVRADHNEIRFHTWGETECCLQTGSLSATLLDPGTISEQPPENPDKCGDDTPPPPVDWCPPSPGQVAEQSGNENPRLPSPTDYRLNLKPCDVLLLEEVKGARTGNAADADPIRRHAVRLTSVTQSHDPVTGQLVIEIEWAAEDALPFALCLSSIGPAPECEPITDVSIARGNVILVDHGRSVSDDLGRVPTQAIHADCGDCCLPPTQWKTPGVFRPALPWLDVTHAEPVPPCLRASPCSDPSEGATGAYCPNGNYVTSASELMHRDPRAALPQVILRSIPAAPDGAPAFTVKDIDDPSELAAAIAQSGANSTRTATWLRLQLAPQLRTALDTWIGQQPLAPFPDDLRERTQAFLTSLEHEWEIRRDLLGSAPDERHVVVEIDDERRVWLRFGNGDTGRAPDAGDSFRAEYRVGNGPVGNVGAETITRIVFDRAFPEGVIIRPRNPLPAVGAQAPEPVAEAKLRAPHVLRNRIERAVTADDYAEIVMRDFAARVQRAAATICRSGTVPQVLVAVDALGQAEADTVLLCEIEHHLRRFRRMGHDVHVAAARGVPLDIGLHICVQDGYSRGHVKSALLEVLGKRVFFHPDNLSFGEGVFLSRIVGSAQAVEGVESVQMLQFERLFQGPKGEIESGVLPLGPLEIARLDNDPSFPELGRMNLTLEGGR